MKDINLDMLENAEDEIIDELEHFSSDSDSTRKRVFSMSEKKYNDMKRKAEITTPVEVSGVETYRRPVWYKPLCAAAALVLLIGGTGTVALINRNSHTVPSDQSSDPQSETAAVTDTTEPFIDAVSDGIPTEEEMKALFEEYIPVYMETKTIRYSESENPDTDSIDFWFYDDSYPADTINDDPDLKSENGSVYRHQTFYKLNDSRFSSIDELKEYYGQYLLDPDKLLWISDRSSEYQPGDTITDENIHFGIAEYNGALYGITSTRSYENYDFFSNILSDKSYNVTDKSFTWVRTVKMDQGTNLDSGSCDIAFSVQMNMEKDTDGRWKINNAILGSVPYDEATDYDSLYDQDNQLHPFIPINSGISEYDAHIAAYNYVLDNYPDMYTGWECWELTDTLPEEYEHITDNYANDNNWFKYRSCNSDGTQIEVYVDRNNTVFAVSHPGN